MSIPYITGLPQVGTPRIAKPFVIIRDSGIRMDFSGGRQIDGTKSWDIDNTGDTDTLRPGMLMGKITSSGLYAPSLLGLSNALYSGGTTLTITASAATNIINRIGQSGTIRITGPATAGGLIHDEVVTFTAVGATTMTITALANNYISGSFLRANDGSGDPLSIIPDGYGKKVTDLDGVNRITVPWHDFPIEAMLKSANILLWPSDTSLRAWLKAAMNGAGAGQFDFDDTF